MCLLRVVVVCNSCSNAVECTIAKWVSGLGIFWPLSDKSYLRFIDQEMISGKCFYTCVITMLSPNNNAVTKRWSCSDVGLSDEVTRFGPLRVVSTNFWTSCFDWNRQISIHQSIDAWYMAPHIHHSQISWYRGNVPTFVGNARGGNTRDDNITSWKKFRQSPHTCF